MIGCRMCALMDMTRMVISGVNGGTPGGGAQLPLPRRIVARGARSTGKARGVEDDGPRIALFTPFFLCICAYCICIDWELRESSWRGTHSRSPRLPPR